MRWVVILLISFTSIAFATENAKQNSNPWELNPFQKAVLADKTPSDSVYTQDENVNWVQRIREPVAGDRVKQSAELLDKIWLQLGYSKGGEKNEETDLPQSFGPKSQLPGKIYQRKITQGKDRYIYCVGMFRTRNSLYAIYFKSFDNVTGSCRDDLVSLGKATVLYK
jgi:hypothetical protein